ncbi:hypothetical protein T05_6556 [Trichinella murrelli]|uniref:Uncharacterized protein n=1 Tax=Trichinella murrelli TaxID=144512 RepID=A0A0V0U534_9BILA|nr:hypothetical protein T05_6556 [Trichinella murrelli]
MHECTARRTPSFDSNKISANDDKSPINLSASRRDNETLKLANFAALFFLLINHCINGWKNGQFYSLFLSINRCEIGSVDKKTDGRQLKD